MKKAVMRGGALEMGGALGIRIISGGGAPSLGSVTNYPVPESHRRPKMTVIHLGLKRALPVTQPCHGFRDQLPRT